VEVSLSGLFIFEKLNVFYHEFARDARGRSRAVAFISEEKEQWL